MAQAGNVFETQGNAHAGAAAGPECILIIDDDIIVGEILHRKLTSLGYSCDFCREGSTALKILTTHPYDLILLDVAMPEMGTFTLLKDALRICNDISAILIAPAVDIAVAVDALKHGADDYITKPFSLEEVVLSVARALEKRRLRTENREYQRTLEEQVESRTRQLKEALETLQQTYHSTLVALGTALDSRDADSNRHSLRVTMYATCLATRLGLNPAAIQAIQQGGLLHDIGKIGIPDELLRKPDKLTESEWQLMRKHPEIGYRILSGIKFLQGAAMLVLHHHEQYDGSGYPAGLRGDEIDLGARIFAVADVLDCMTSNTSLKEATDFESARKEILRIAGTQLDPAIVETFAAIPLQEWEKIRREVSLKTSL